MDRITDWMKKNKALIGAAMVGAVLMGLLITQGSCGG